MIADYTVKPDNICITYLTVDILPPPHDYVRYSAINEKIEAHVQSYLMHNLYCLIVCTRGAIS